MAVGGSSCSMDGGAKKLKKPKAKKAAKRKLTPYNKFVKKMFKEFRIKYPDYSAPAIMKEIGIEWRKTKTKA
jgi:hypothetical protein